MASLFLPNTPYGLHLANQVRRASYQVVNFPYSDYVTSNHPVVPLSKKLNEDNLNIFSMVRIRWDKMAALNIILEFGVREETLLV